MAARQHPLFLSLLTCQPPTLACSWGGATQEPVRSPLWRCWELSPAPPFLAPDSLWNSYTPLWEGDPTRLAVRAMQVTVPTQPRRSCVTQAKSAHFSVPAISENKGSLPPQRLMVWNELYEIRPSGKNAAQGLTSQTLNELQVLGSDPGFPTTSDISSRLAGPVLPQRVFVRMK